MIWFACKGCGKAHGRPENSGGTLIFCDCGQGVSVPWESTMAAPAQPPPESRPAPPAFPRLEPMSLGDEGRPSPPPVALPAAARKYRAPKRRDRRFCFNHEELASTKTCAACGEGFCGDCVVEFQGKTLCGPCKNFQVKLAQKPPKLSGRAIAALLVSLLFSPFAFCPLVAGGSYWAVVSSAMTVLPQFIGVGLGLLALRDTDRNPRVRGRGVAIAGLVSALVFLVLAGFLTWMGARLT